FVRWCWSAWIVRSRAPNNDWTDVDPKKWKGSLAKSMTKRGAKRTADDEFAAFVLDQLAVLGVTSKRMFGGHGLYAGGVFFGLMDEGEAYLRIDDASKPDFVARGMTPFEPWPGHVSATYWKVPADVLEDAETFVAWARRSVAAAA